MLFRSHRYPVFPFNSLSLRRFHGLRLRLPEDSAVRVTSTAGGLLSDFRQRTGRISMRAARLAAAVACACGLSACASMSEKMATDMSQNSLIGLPATAPARPEAPPAFPAVHDIPPPRGNSVLSNTEQVRMEEELVAARDQLNGTAARNAADKAKKAKKDGAAVIPDRKSTRLNSSHIPLSRMPSSA